MAELKLYYKQLLKLLEPVPPLKKYQFQKAGLGHSVIAFVTIFGIAWYHYMFKYDELPFEQVRFDLFSKDPFIKNHFPPPPPTSKNTNTK